MVWAQPTVCVKIRHCSRMPLLESCVQFWCDTGGQRPSLILCQGTVERQDRIPWGPVCNPVPNSCRTEKPRVLGVTGTVCVGDQPLRLPQWKVLFPSLVAGSDTACVGLVLGTPR